MAAEFEDKSRYEQRIMFEVGDEFITVAKDGRARCWRVADNGLLEERPWPRR